MSKTISRGADLLRALGGRSVADAEEIDRRRAPQANHASSAKRREMRIKAAARRAISKK